MTRDSTWFLAICAVAVLLYLVSKHWLCLVFACIALVSGFAARLTEED